MSEHLNVPIQLLAAARVEKLERELAEASMIHPDYAERRLASVKELVMRVNVARNLGDPEYRAYLRACVLTQDDNLITLF
jgi:Tfp pilus assembly protein PilF